MEAGKHSCGDSGGFFYLLLEGNPAVQHQALETLINTPGVAFSGPRATYYPVYFGYLAVNTVDLVRET